MCPLERKKAGITDLVVADYFNLTSMIYNGAIEMNFLNHHLIQILSWRYNDKRYWHKTFKSVN
jgi:hypothetical protein